ncbi:thiamine pyrophosphate-binding protein [Anaerospora hongkongensis]|uniref:thiamine pyrophosphate-binding protein n=1 Tax=Anaerospora hongkongensis TaxID=244830 RepID=UPI00289F1A1B|nr:thiamine pyrophosphate-binding protein [Anaerospora hongkongensis]
MKKNMSEQIIQYLEDRGVEHIFGLCGHTNIAFLAALSKSKKIKFINVRHEQIASHAADGYARVTKRLELIRFTQKVLENDAARQNGVIKGIDGPEVLSAILRGVFLYLCEYKRLVLYRT